MTGPVLIGVGIVNILFGFSDSVAAVYVLYSLNAILQGTSFPPMAKIMASWFSKNERGRWWAIVEAALLFTIMGFALYGPHMLFAVGCLDVTHKDAAGSITGFRGLFSYVGAAMAGVPVIMVKNSWAWSGVYIYAVIAILLTTLSLALLSRLHRL